jgi:hypothetical protein
MKTSGMGSQDPAALGSSNRPWRTFLWCGSASEPSESLSAPRYLAEYRAVRKIHKAASEGDAAKVQHLLDNCKKGVNDTDKKNRSQGLGVIDGRGALGCEGGAHLPGLCLEGGHPVEGPYFCRTTASHCRLLST